MGYYTSYSLEIQHPVSRLGLDVDFREIIIDGLRKKYEWACYCLTPTGESDDMGKWYEHEDHLKELSKNYPAFLFVLAGEGEEQGDQWKKYFLNGKMQVEKAEIKIGDFDPEKLK